METLLVAARHNGRLEINFRQFVREGQDAQLVSSWQLSYKPATNIFTRQIFLYKTMKIIFGINNKHTHFAMAEFKESSSF